MKVLEIQKGILLKAKSAKFKKVTYEITFQSNEIEV